MKELTIEQQLEEDIEVLTTEKLFKKAAEHGIPMNNLFGILSKIFKEKYTNNYRTACFRRELSNLFEAHAHLFTAKEMSFLTNHTLGTLILESKNFKK